VEAKSSSSTIVRFLKLRYVTGGYLDKTITGTSTNQGEVFNFYCRVENIGIVDRQMMLKMAREMMKMETTTK